MNRVLHFAWALVLAACAVTCSASDKQPCSNPCGIPAVWSDFNVFALRMSVIGQSGNSFWTGRFDKDSNDIQIEVEASDGKKITRGKILMIGGRVMAVQGPVTEQGAEIDALDAPVLGRQLVLHLLAKALPNGPAGIVGAQEIDFKEEKDGIEIATPSAGGSIPVPWRVRGEVTVVAAGVVEYQLTLTARAWNSAETSETGLDGRLSKTASAKIDDAISLGGWNLFGLGAQTRKAENGTVVDYGAAPTDAKYKTVADIRKKIAQDDYPGEPDKSKDFTGFWKEDCEQAFGLQIRHYGPHGEYAVTFCGPGGCGDPGEERGTFITKDLGYQVVSEGEIRVRSADGWDTYHKCTTDTHPVLKYRGH